MGYAYTVFEFDDIDSSSLLYLDNGIYVRNGLRAGLGQPGGGGGVVAKGRLQKLRSRSGQPSDDECFKVSKSILDNDSRG